MAFIDFSLDLKCKNLISLKSIVCDDNADLKQESWKIYKNFSCIESSRQ